MADAFLQAYAGLETEVLFEREVEAGIYEGHTTNYIKVRAASQRDLTNQICTVKILRAEKEELFGSVDA